MTSREVDYVQEPVSPALPLAVAHVADAYRRYPGDTVTFYTQVEVASSLANVVVRIVLPSGLTLKDYQGSDPHVLPRITLHNGVNSLIWHVDGAQDGVQATTRCQYRVMATVERVVDPVLLESRAVVTGEGHDGATLQVDETVSIAVAPQGRYINYLPAIYRDDDLTGRFLMLFESFWGPVSSQIENLHYYFDPCMTPPEFLPWLASWINLVLDERWSVEKRRQLLAAAVMLYRKRGTRQGLEQYLQIYTGTVPRIIEHRAHNFRLGPDARLGPAIALGRDNEPHTFTVVLHLPAVSTVEGPDGAPCEDQMRRRRIEAIIEAEKPAHAGYQLRIEVEK